jgi:rod shape determining protein RodA
MIDGKLIREIDWFLLALLLANTALGVILIYSASYYLPGHFFLKQLLWVFISLLFLVLLLAIDYRILVEYSHYVYLFFVIVLIVILIFGRTVAGAKSWFRVAFMGGQPSELAKIALMLLLGKLFFDFKRNSLSLGVGLLSGAAVSLPLLLVALQPDMGTAISFLPILFASLFLAGLGKKTIVILVIVALAAGFSGWNFFLKDYQKIRVATLLFPGQDPKGSGYHILQSKIAIGSGGLFGKGFKKGTQSQLRFLPARHTDFIFSVLGEELGFAGILATFLLYFLFLFRLFQSTGKSRDRAGVYLVFMAACLFSFQFLVNVLMIIGLLPITGIPLPLFSYGGSSLLASYLCVGLVMNVTMRRYVNV